MAEEPATWGPAEHVVSKALDEAHAAHAAEICGLSTVRRVTDALREAGLLPSGRPPCWLCLGLGAIAIHGKWSAEAGKTLWAAHRPQSRTHPVRPCPVCTLTVNPAEEKS